MVIIKVTDGVETRKLKISGEVTFSQLQEKLATLFPSSVQGDQPLNLQYRDSDGDLITLSSEEELQGVLSTLADDAMLRLHIKRPARSVQSRFNHPHHRHNDGESLLDLIFKPDSSSMWDHFDKQLKQTDSLFQQLWGRPQEEETSSESTANKDKGKENQSQPTEQDDETVKSKLTEEPVKSETGSDKDQTPVIHCQTVLSYEPRVQHTWFGPRTVLKPVRYNVVYWGQPDQPKESGEQATPTTANKPGEPAPQEAPVK